MYKHHVPVYDQAKKEKPCLYDLQKARYVRLEYMCVCVCVDTYLEWCVVLTLPNYRGTEIRQQNGPFIHASALKGTQD